MDSNRQVTVECDFDKVRLRFRPQVHVAVYIRTPIAALVSAAEEHKRA